MSAPWQHPQQVLALGLPVARRFDTFCAGDNNRLALSAVQAFTEGRLQEQQLYLWGEPGVGKSHLLNAACEAASHAGLRVAYLSGEHANQADALTGLDNGDMLCIDDLHRLAPAAEIALFHCINRCREQGCQLLFGARQAPEGLGIVLPDLVTRLSWGPVFQLQAMSETELHQALREECERRALVVAPDVLDYLLRRCPRDMQSMKGVIDVLDDASLRAQRRVTIPLVRNVLGDAVAPGI